MKLTLRSIVCLMVPVVFGIDLTFDPASLDKLKEDHDHVVFFNISSVTSNLMYVKIDNQLIAELIEPVNSTLYVQSNYVYNVAGVKTGYNNHSMKIKGLFLGHTTVKFYMSDHMNLSNTFTNGSVKASEKEVPLEGVWWRHPVVYRVSVVRDAHVVDGIFTVTVILIVFLASISIGCKMELAVVKKVLKKPIAPAIGMFCQFVVMPMIGFGVAKALQLDGALGLGLFAMGCAPGGGASNMYTVLLDGDVDLSVTMTLISTILSLGMVPLWLFTLGKHAFVDDTFTLNIPYQNAMYSLASIIVAVAIGLLIKYKKPTWAAKLTRCMKPTFLILLLVVFTFGVWANLYIFTIFHNHPLNLVAGCLLPWCGFLFGGLIALICRQDFTRVKTIAIETGIQNSGIPILLLKVSLPQPDADIAIAPPVAASCFTPIPLLIAIAIHVFYKRYKVKKLLREKQIPFDDVHVGNGDGMNEECGNGVVTHNAVDETEKDNNGVLKSSNHCVTSV